MGVVLGPLFAAIAAFFAQWMAKKTVMVTALVAGSLALTAAFVAAVSALMSGLAASVPSWVVGLGYLIPDNMAACFGAIVSARIARWIYDYHFSVLKMAGAAA